MSCRVMSMMRNGGVWGFMDFFMMVVVMVVKCREQHYIPKKGFCNGDRDHSLRLLGGGGGGRCGSGSDMFTFNDVIDDL